MIVLLWGVCIYNLWAEYDHDFLFDSLIQNALIVVATIVSTLVIYSERARERQGKRLFLFPAIISCICIVGLLATTYVLKRRDMAPTLFYATTNTSGLGKITLDFRSDNTFRFGVHHQLSARYYRGRYHVKDSFVYLETRGIEEHIKGSRLMFTANPAFNASGDGNALKMLFGTPEEDINARTLLYQIDEEGRTIESAPSFKVIGKPFG